MADRADIDRDIMRNPDGSYNVTCVVCGSDFTSKRIDATFCGNTCRSKHHRQQKEMSKLIDRATESINALIDRLPRDRHSKTFDVLRDLATDIRHALGTVEISEPLPLPLTYEPDRPQKPSRYLTPPSMWIDDHTDAEPVQTSATEPPSVTPSTGDVRPDRADNDRRPDAAEPVKRVDTRTRFLKGEKLRYPDGSLIQNLDTLSVMTPDETEPFQVREIAPEFFANIPARVALAKKNNAFLHYTKDERTAMRDALENKNKTVRRHPNNRRLHRLVFYGLMKITKRTDYHTWYRLTADGERIAATMPSFDDDYKWTMSGI